MNFQSLLLSIEGSFAIGSLLGLLVGLLFARGKLGCSVLAAVPVAMIFFISWWQGQHPENLRSTSALDFVFGPLWISVGALGGHYLGRRIRAVFSTSD